MMDWVKVSERLPAWHEELEVSYDEGKTFEDGVMYSDERRCMMAGIAGGNGYFWEGFCTSYESRADTKLILDTPTHWRYC